MKLNSIISDGAVFQRNQPIVVFGEARGKITVKFLDEQNECWADGKLCISFSPHPAGGPYEMHFFDSTEKKTIKNIMIGEVILLAGQSNAELTIAETYDRNTFFESNENIRFYAPTRPSTDTMYRLLPLESQFNEKWNMLLSDTAAEWSAIALHTAIYFQKKLNIAVGIVTCFKEASVIESFLSEKANEKFDIDQSKLMSDHFYPAFAWNKPSFLFHYMLQKIIPFQISTVIWYQGESNRTVYEGTFYDKMLVSLIEEWRKLFEVPNLPFVIVQINLYTSHDTEEGVTAIREAQKRAVEQTENCCLVKIDDLGEHEKIHPENKKEVSERICAAIETLNQYD